MRSTKASQRASKASSEAISSRTVMRGGSPASIGCSERTRCAKAWRVQIAARSRAPSATRQRSDVSERVWSVLRMRSDSSLAAFSVKVMAAMRSACTPSSTRATNRSTTHLVLPEPAPASRNIVSPRRYCTAARAGASVVVTTGSSARKVARSPPMPGRNACVPSPVGLRTCSARRVSRTSSRHGYRGGQRPVGLGKLRLECRRR